MSDIFCCDDKETLVAYLYGEIDPDAKRDVEAHLRRCAECSEEVLGLQSVRRDIDAWVPPMPDLGFTIVQQTAAQPAVLTSARWSALRTLPVWAQAAAAVLVLGIGAGLANVQVRYGSEGLLVTTGWMTPVSTPATPPAAQESWRPALAALEQTLRGEMAQMKHNAEPVAVSTRAADQGDAALMRRVQSMIDANDQRHRQETSLMLTQFTRDVDLQRRADLMRINQTFGALQGRTYKTEAGQAEMMNVLRRVSGQPIP
jgi:putative zinc finger protein